MVTATMSATFTAHRLVSFARFFESHRSIAVAVHLSEHLCTGSISLCGGDDTIAIRIMSLKSIVGAIVCAGERSSFCFFEGDLSVAIGVHLGDTLGVTTVQVCDEDNAVTVVISALEHTRSHLLSVDVTCILRFVCADVSIAVQVDGLHMRGFEGEELGFTDGAIAVRVELLEHLLPSVSVSSATPSIAVLRACGGDGEAQGAGGGERCDDEFGVHGRLHRIKVV